LVEIKDANDFLDSVNKVKIFHQEDCGIYEYGEDDDCNCPYRDLNNAIDYFKQKLKKDSE
jgi:hypothetical protein